MAILAVTASLFAPRSALAWNVRVCVDVDVFYSDAGGGDYWTNNGVDKAARGFRYQIRSNSNNAVLYSGHLAEGGTWAGCTPQHSLTGSVYVRTFPDGEVNGFGFQHDEATAVDSSAFSPTSDGTIARTIDYADESYAHLVAIAYGLWRYDGSASGETVTVHADATDDVYATGNNVHFFGETDQKYLILHELGHLVAHWHSPTPNESELPPTEPMGCNGGGPFIKYYQSHAISQGIADFFSIAIWNDAAEGDCEVRWWRTADVDLNTTVDYQIGASLTCSGDPDTSAPDNTDGRNWLRDVYLGQAGTCGDPGDTLTGRSTRYDWMQYFWGLRSEGLSFDDVYAVLVEADPSTWDVDGSGFGADDPWPRWNLAAVLLGGAIEDAHLEHRDTVEDY